MRFKHIIKGYEILKKRALEEFAFGEYENSYKTLRSASSLAIQFNWRYSDDEFEDLLDEISKKYIPNENVNLTVNEERYVLIDDFCRSFILAIQYLDAFKAMGKHVLYIVTISDMANNSSLSILNRVRNYDNVEVLVVDDCNNDFEKSKMIWNSIVRFAPSKVFLHINELSPCLTALYRLPKDVKKYIINLSDQRFWLGCKAIDYSLEFRPFGSTVSYEKRGLRKDQILYVPFYPVADGNAFCGFPELGKDKVIIFSGGDFYKTISPKQEYWTVVKRILDDNPNTVILFAIKSKMDKAADFVERFIKKNHFEKRFINIGFRKDINEVFAHSDIYLGTCPTSGSLMSQLAALNKKPILQLYLPGTSDDETEQAICHNEEFPISFTRIEDLLSEARHLINDCGYRNKQGERIYNAMIKPDQFVEILDKTLNKNETINVSFRNVDYQKITERWYWIEKEGYINAGSNVLGLIGKRSALKYMPQVYLHNKCRNMIRFITNHKYFTREYYLRKFVWRLFPEQRYWYQTKQYYHRMTGKVLDYKHPEDLNEKLMWLTRYWRDPIKTICADKYLVRDYLTAHGYGNILVPLIGVYDSVDDIDFEKLPLKFVLKCNHGCGCNIICTDKLKLDIEDSKAKLRKWMDTDYSELMWEIHYKGIPRKIICEELISDNAPVEYQFWCLNGHPESILVCRKNFDLTYDSASYSLNWERLYDRLQEPSDDVFEKPHDLGELTRMAEDISKPFPFVRVDFYEVDRKYYFAELTFTPAANYIHKCKKEFLDRLGRKLILPR